MRLDQLRARIRTAQELGEIVHVLRGLSEARLRQARRTLGSFSRYADEASAALQRGLTLLPAPEASPTLAPGGRAALLVLGSEHGFVGELNERLVGAARAALAERPGATLLLGGTRLIRAAEEGQLASQVQLPLAATVQGCQRAARALSDSVAERLARGELGATLLVFPRRTGSRRWEVAREEVLPVRLDCARGCPPPAHHLPPGPLLARLVVEHVFARIAGAVAESFLSEQAARLTALDGAERGIDELLSGLRQRERAARQDLITTEILEVSAGATALEEGA